MQNEFINKVHHGNCVDLAKLYLPDESVDLILTDPPFGIAYKSQISNNHDIILNDKFEEFTRDLTSWFQTMQRIIKKNGVVLMFCSGGGKTPSSAIATLEGMKYFNLINTVIWDKGSAGIGWKYKPQYEVILVFSKVADGYNWYDTSHTVTNVLKYNRHIPSANDHPTQKPLALLKKLIKIHTKENDLVCDLFAGSGSTLVAAKELGRNYIGFELFDAYYNLATENTNRAVRMKVQDLSLFKIPVEVGA